MGPQGKGKFIRRAPPMTQVVLNSENRDPRVYKDSVRRLAGYVEDQRELLNGFIRGLPCCFVGRLTFCILVTYIVCHPFMR